MEYRKRKKVSDTWHWCTNCTNWPKPPDEYDVSHSKPTSGELCNQCKGKDDNNNCDKQN